jgi:hypothetical protein
MQTAVGEPSPGTPAVQSAASDHRPLTGARQLSAHEVWGALADATEVVAGTDRGMVRAAVNRRRQRVILSFQGGTAPLRERALSLTKPLWWEYAVTVLWISTLISRT